MTKFCAAFAMLASISALGSISACAPIQGRESAGQYGDDVVISNKVRGQLIKDQALKAFDIHVETMQGVVQLSGFVETAAQKAQAERIARSVEGVRSVRDNIVVKG
jgi:osmotically-inducible protein OsmY